MVPHKVVKILKQPKQGWFRMDHTTIHFWSVAVILRQNNEEHEASVTFETLEDANKLKIGDVFLR